MANERTIVSLSPEAREAITKRMKARGETASTYFSEGVVRSVAPTEEKSMTGTVVEDPETAILRDYLARKADVGLQSGREQVAISMGLYDSPRQARTAAWLRSNLGANGLLSTDEPGSYYVPGFKDRTGRILKNSKVDFDTVARMGFNAAELAKLAESRAVTPDQQNAAEYAKLLLGLGRRVLKATDPAELDELRISMVPGREVQQLHVPEGRTLDKGTKARVKAIAPAGYSYGSEYGELKTRVNPGDVFVHDPRIQDMAGAGYSRRDLDAIAEVVDTMVARRRGQLAWWRKYENASLDRGKIGRG